MIHKALHIAVFASLWMSAMAGAATVPLRLEPASGWVLDYADERCSLNRRFASGDEWAHLRIDNYGSRDTFRLLIFGSAVPSTGKVAQRIKLRYNPDAEARRATSLNGRYEKDPASSFSLSFLPTTPEDKLEGPAPLEWVAARMAEIKPPDPNYESRIDEIELEFWNGRKVTVVVGNMSAPLGAIRTCVDDLQKHWGLDPEREKGLSRHAAPRPTTLKAMQQHYPVSMLMSGISSYVPVRVMVDEAGQPTNCVVQVPSVQKDFKDAVCSGMADAYVPALDRDGKPVASVFVTAVVYQIAG